MEKIFSEILSMSFDSAWLIIAVIIVRAVLQKSPMYFRKILWGLVGFRLVVPFSFESSLSLVPNEVPQTAERVAGQVVAAPVEQGLSFADVAPVLWLVVCGSFFIYGVISYIRLKLKLIDGILLKGIVYQSERIQSPFVCGFIKPKIYIPYGLDEVTQNHVLQHEETHIKYADHIIKTGGFVVLCIHWFNPLVWMSYFLLCKDIELSCDESVVKKYDDNQCKQYAKALLDLGVNKVKLSACPIAFGEVSIKTRIKNIVNYKKASKILVFASVGLCIGVSLCFMTEPEATLKEKVEEAEVSDKIIESVTEKVDESTTEVAAKPAIETTIETVSEPETEVVEEVYEVSEDTTIKYEEVNSIIESQEAEMLEEFRRSDATLMEDANKQSDFTFYQGSYTSNSSDNSIQTPTMPSFNWDLAGTQSPTNNYGNTNRPHFEGNQWVY